MIPLRLRASVEGRGAEPFVVILSDDATVLSSHAPTGLLEDCRAVLTEQNGQGLTFNISPGTLQISGVTFDEVQGDVLFVIPERKQAHRLIRAQSEHNTLLVTEQCDQLCVMCSQPPKKEHQDLFAFFLIAVQLAPKDAVIGISGGEPTLHKAALFQFISDVYSTRPDVRIHVLTNAQHFTNEDIGVLSSKAFHDVCWGIPIYSSNAEAHDAIVKKPGAFDRLLSSFNILMQAGSYIELRTVVMRSNRFCLGELANFIAAHLSFSAVWAIMQLENIGFARKAWDEIFLDNSVDFSEIGNAINTATARGVNVDLYNFPLCTIPGPYRTFAVRSISDWKQRYIAECDSCSARELCAGFFEWYPEERGFSRIRPI